jgi:hypothetical protein
MTLIFSRTLHVPHGNQYLGILWVKATAVFVHLQIYLFALTSTNSYGHDWVLWASDFILKSALAL